MAKNPKPADQASAKSASTPETQAAKPAESEAEAKARAVREAQEEAAEANRDLAEEQREEIAAGGDGQAAADEAAKVNAEAAERAGERAGVAIDPATGHTMAGPKDSPVNYASETLRRPPQRILAPKHVSNDAFDGRPLVSLPYGSEPKSFDPATGGAVKNEAAAEDAQDGDEDADTDRGLSAADRKARAEASA